MDMEMDIEIKMEPVEDPLSLQPPASKESKYSLSKSIKSIDEPVVHRCTGKIALGNYRHNGIHSIPSTSGSVPPMITHHKNMQPIANQMEAEIIVLDSSSDEDSNDEENFTNTTSADRAMIPLDNVPVDGASKQQIQSSTSQISEVDTTSQVQNVVDEISSGKQELASGIEQSRDSVQSTLVDVIMANAVDDSSIDPPVPSEDNANSSRPKSMERQTSATNQPFYCDVCQQVYTSYKGLSNHQKTKKHAANVKKQQKKI